MPWNLSELPPTNGHIPCGQTEGTFFAKGSNFFSRADWNCVDNEHKAWLITDLDTKVETRTNPPALFLDLAAIAFQEPYGYRDNQAPMKAYHKTRSTRLITI